MGMVGQLKGDNYWADNAGMSVMLWERRYNRYRKA